MKQKTIEKYINFLRTLTANGTIYNVTEFARLRNVGYAFILFLKKRGYLERMAGGSYKLKAGGLGFAHIVNEYKKAAEKKQPAVAEFVAAVEKAYPKHTDIDLLAREQEAIDILGQIMRDNSHITYDVVRKIKKVELTQIL